MLREHLDDRKKNHETDIEQEDDSSHKGERIIECLWE
jgi:hypothetical protein